jgi:hypothetical protein
LQLELFSPKTIMFYLFGWNLQKFYRRIDNG